MKIYFFLFLLVFCRITVMGTKEAVPAEYLTWFFLFFNYNYYKIQFSKEAKVCFLAEAVGFKICSVLLVIFHVNDKVCYGRVP